ncbi:hypothetical protein GGTG_02703 [Gaeumannomyces tritici R3-111a-1]|uniref:Uncharacterized protein n=1 Tax=Gaeumannomyces tritici (strain R3-111a-1) TaxID=644352 RepID=J3NN45_GAET3|nr:hypothetical protein GGTG_02703 [Gaeumannomyces tritici R3-111a-1]EJT77597.1 hypothetical protein GGTG_02703 [Gaeumannomyces tritici R3-111a-1]
MSANGELCRRTDPRGAGLLCVDWPLSSMASLAPRPISCHLVGSRGSVPRKLALLHAGAGLDASTTGVSVQAHAGRAGPMS